MTLRRSGRRSSPRPFPRTVVGISGWDTTCQLATAVDSGLRGETSSYWVAILHRIDAQATGNAGKDLLRNTPAGDTAGFRISTASQNTLLRFVAVATGPLTISSPTYTVLAGDVGKLMLTFGVYDTVNNLVRLYPKNGTEEGAGTATTGLAPLQASGTRMTIGRYNVSGANPSDANTILAVMGGSGLPSSAEIAESYRATRQSGWIAEIPGKTSHKWQLTASFAGTVANPRGVHNLSMTAGSASGLVVETVANSWA